MKMTMHPDMIEATRLTREGRLNEANTLLQRMLQGAKEPDVAQAGPRATAGSPPRGAAHVIDVTPEMIEGAAPRPAGNTSANSRPPLPRRLRDFIERVGRIGVPLPVAGRSSAHSPTGGPDVRPRGGRFLTASFADHAGARDYKLYIPSAYHGQPLPLVVMLHGCTQSADDFAAGTGMNLVAEERACFVAYPAQPSSANGAKCWNWFKPGDQQRDRGEPSLIAGITRQIARDYAIDPQRIYVAGLSAGGAAAAIMGATYPDIYAAVGVHSGLPCGAASDLTSAFTAMQQGGSRTSNGSRRRSALNGHGRLVPTIVFHGDQDSTVHPQNGDDVIAQSRPAGLGALRQVTERGVAGGRTYSRTNHVDANDTVVLEMWVVHGAGHAWSGGNRAGSFTDPRGPDASREMVRFFLEHSHPATKPR